MAGLVPAIHVLIPSPPVDDRVKPGHDVFLLARTELG
jgi:hypothetical protein